jgi:hypothetical protein
MRILKWLAYLVLGLVVAVAGLFGAARLHDGPLGMAPGGAFESGEIVKSPVQDWSFVRDIATVELQLEGEDTSRTVWILADGASAYVPASLGFPPFKTWHKRADRDGSAWLRIDGKRYPVTLTRTEDGGLYGRVAAEVTRKYAGGPPSDAAVWVFAVTSREP